MAHPDRRRARRGASAAIAIAAASLASPARAEPAVHDLRHDVAADAVVTGVLGVGWIASEIAKPWLAPRACRVCSRDAAGRDTLNPVDRGVRDAVRWERSGGPDVASYVTGFALAPVSAYGGLALAAAHDGHASGAGVDALLVTEAVVVAAAVNQAVKFAVGRERPFVHALPADRKRATSQPSDNDLSFFSGHTTLAFSLASAAGTVATLRGYRAAPLVWASGIGLGVITGELRIAADKHYFSDVVTGALVGTAIGALVPLLAHPRADAPGSVTGAPASAPAATLSVGGRF
jgi:membrane-associated phospholipid phosphatase